MRREQERLWPKGYRRLRLGGRIDLIADLRSVVIVAVLLVVATAVSIWATTLGDTDVTLREVGAALLGTVDPDLHRTIIEWRMPRVALAIVGGAALGASGAIFQSLTRNPLGSPDIIGFSTGAYTGALIVILIFGGNYLMQAAGALVGGIATAVVVYVLAYSRGVQGYRLIVIGIAISAMLTSLNSYLIIEARLEDAISAATWGAGSLANVRWTGVGAALLIIVILLPIAFGLNRSMRTLEMGDDAAVALGVPAERLRLLLVLVGVALTAAVTAIAGPIAFVALAAPQIAKRLTRSGGVSVVPAAAMGAALLAVSDVLARSVFGSEVPVGIVTVCLGGTYLVWLLMAQAKRM